MKNYPKRQQNYTLAEVLELELRDSPYLSVMLEDPKTGQLVDAPIQDSHMTHEQLLSVPGLKDTVWTYLYETDEWIPLFRFAAAANTRPITDFITIEPEIDPYNRDKVGFWCVPIGFAREQYYAINEHGEYVRRHDGSPYNEY